MGTSDSLDKVFPQGLFSVDTSTTSGSTRDQSVDSTIGSDKEPVGTSDNSSAKKTSKKPTKKGTKRKTKSDSPLAKHLSGECGCSLESNPNRCVYQVFCDGWEFTPDVGNGQSRGEIFTPRFIVDKMITDAGIIPSEAVYDGDYSHPDAHRFITTTVVEPAVGTGNFTTTVVFHKLMFAAEHSDNTDQYNRFVLDAVGSIYAYDIDAGNLEVTRRRILGSDDVVNSGGAYTRWVDFIKGLNPDADEHDTAGVVSESLLEAQQHWSSFLDEDGVVRKLYREHTGEDMGAEMVHAVENILDKNIQLFNGISRDNDSTIPGYVNVVWDRWDNGKIVSLFSMNNTMIDSEIRRVDEQLAGESLTTRERKALERKKNTLEAQKVDIKSYC